MFMHIARKIFGFNNLYMPIIFHNSAIRTTCWIWIMRNNKTNCCFTGNMFVVQVFNNIFCYKGHVAIHNNKMILLPELFGTRNCIAGAQLFFLCYKCYVIFMVLRNNIGNIFFLMTDNNNCWNL